MQVAVGVNVHVAVLVNVGIGVCVKVGTGVGVRTVMMTVRAPEIGLFFLSPPEVYS